MEAKLYVGNLPYETTEDDLSTLFAEVGTVKSVAIIKDRETGRSKGFAFVEMSTENEAINAVNLLNGKLLGMRELRVNSARPREGSGGFGGRRRGENWSSSGLGGDSTTDAPPPKKK